MHFADLFKQSSEWILMQLCGICVYLYGIMYCVTLSTLTV